MPSFLSTDSDTIEFKSINGQINVDEAKGIVECFVSGVGNKDSVGDIVLPGAFTESLKRRKPRVVWGHDWNHPIGKVLEIYEVPASDLRLPAKMRSAGIGGLFARVQFNLKSEKGREAFANIAFYGEDQEWSIGYKTLDAIYDNQRQANLLREVELYEVSPVLHGANQLTGTISIKSEQQEDEVDSFGKSKWEMFDRDFAERIKKEHPKIWAAGGNIKGNDQYRILTKIAEQNGKAETPDQIAALKLREAWVARHEGDFRLPGVVAQMKWLSVGSRGEAYMKNLIREEIKKRAEKSFESGDSFIEDGDEEALFTFEEIKETGMMAERKPCKCGDHGMVEPEADFSDENDLDPDALMSQFFTRMAQAYSRRAMRGRRRRIGVGQGERFMKETDEDGPCWPGYVMVGMKPGKNGRMVPNCVPAEGVAKPTAKQLIEEFHQKAGRVISSGNLEKLQQAMDILREVIAAGGRAEIEMKLNSSFISADTEDLFDLKSFIDPVLEYHGADAEITEDGIHVKGLGLSNMSFSSAISNAVSNFNKGQ
jgi:HK97 family phage prohead protease